MSATTIIGHIAAGHAKGADGKSKIKCADGFSMSVIAGPGVYGDGVDAVEVGYPSEVDESLMPYCEDPTRPTKTVYVYVPIIIAQAVIDRHNAQQGGTNASR